MNFYIYYSMSTQFCNMLRISSMNVKVNLCPVVRSSANTWSALEIEQASVYRLCRVTLHPA